MPSKNKPQLQFAAAKAFTGQRGFPAAVESSLKQFQADTVHRAQRGQATVIATVAVPEDGVYFAIVLAGPFQSLEALQEALAQVANGYLSENLKRIGME